MYCDRFICVLYFININACYHKSRFFVAKVIVLLALMFLTSVGLGVDIFPFIVLHVPMRRRLLSQVPLPWKLILSCIMQIAVSSQLNFMFMQFCHCSIWFHVSMVSNLCAHE